MPTQTLTHICKIKNHDMVGSNVDRVGLACSKLWNIALYHTRQVWSETGEIPSAYDTQKAVQEHYWYKQLPAHTAQAVTQELWQAYKSWFGYRRSGNLDAHPPKYRKQNGHVPPSTITFKRSGFQLEGTTLRLSRGRTVTAETGKQYLFLELAIPPQADVSDVRQVRLVRRKGVWEVHLVCEVPIPEESPGEGVAALDVGIVNLAAVVYSDGTSELYSGRGLLAQGHYFARQVAKCKPAGWQPGSRAKAASKRKRALSCKQMRRRQEFLHAITRRIVDTCIEKGIGTLVMGSMKHIRQPPSGIVRKCGKAGTTELHAWPFDTFVQMLAYKTNLAGITLVQLSEWNTSRTCSVCGTLNSDARVHRGLFVCSECGTTINADVNGAVNLLHKYLHGLKKSTGVPVRVGPDVAKLIRHLPTIWPEPLVNRYDWGAPSPIVRVAGSVPVDKAHR